MSIDNLIMSAIAMFAIIGFVFSLHFVWILETNHTPYGQPTCAGSPANNLEDWNNGFQHATQNYEWLIKTNCEKDYWPNYCYNYLKKVN